MDPLYEDALIVVYPTSPRAGRDFVLTSELGAGVGLIRASVAPTEVIQGGGFFVDLRWGSRSSPDRDLDVCLALVNEAGEMLQDTCFDLVPGWPTSEWPAGAIGIGDYKLLVNPNLAGGEYALTARLIEAETGYGVGDAVSLEIVTIEELRLALKHVDSGTFGQDLRLLGYDIVQEAGILNLTLFWRAERRMDVPYKIFVHLKEVGSGSLVAQADVMPRNWMYPTTQWRAGEIVSDKVVLHLDKVSGGRYTVAVGVYHPDTGVRLPLHDVEGGGESSDALILQELTVP